MVCICIIKKHEKICIFIIGRSDSYVLVQIFSNRKLAVWHETEMHHALAIFWQSAFMKQCYSKKPTAGQFSNLAKSVLYSHSCREKLYRFFPYIYICLWEETIRFGFCRQPGSKLHHPFIFSPKKIPRRTSVLWTREGAPFLSPHWFLWRSIISYYLSVQMSNDIVAYLERKWLDSNSIFRIAALLMDFFVANAWRVGGPVTWLQVV